MSLLSSPPKKGVWPRALVTAPPCQTLTDVIVDAVCVFLLLDPIVIDLDTFPPGGSHGYRRGPAAYWLVCTQGLTGVCLRVSVCVPATNAEHQT